QAEDGIRDFHVTGVQTCALPIYHDRIFAAQFVDQFLDLRGRDRVERRAWFVHQDHLGVDRNRTRDAEALLLAARKRGAAFAEPEIGRASCRASGQSTVVGGYWRK